MFSLLSTAPEGIGVVSVTSRTSSTLSATWQRPSEPNGLIIQYRVLATPLNTEGLLSPLGSAVTVTLNIEVIGTIPTTLSILLFLIHIVSYPYYKLRM